MEFRYEEGISLSQFGVRSVAFPTQVCSICLSRPVYRTTRDRYGASSLCRGCYHILHHPSIESPGDPYSVMVRPYGTDSLIFVNPRYGDLVAEATGLLKRSILGDF